VGMWLPPYLSSGRAGEKYENPRYIPHLTYSFRPRERERGRGTGPAGEILDIANVYRTR
jgi:hypothetical protein